MHHSRRARFAAATIALVVALTGLIAAPASAATPMGPYSISGIVRNQDGTPVAAGAVTVTTRGADITLKSTVTVDGGTFTLSNLVAGNYYLEFNSPDYQTCWLGGVTSSYATDGTVVVVTGDVTGIEQTLAPASLVSGRVSLGEPGNYAGAGQVQVTATGGVYGSSRRVTTSADGTFVLRDLERGSYTLLYEYLDGKDYTFANGTSSFVVTPTSWTFENRNATIPHAGRISGHVELSPGVPVGAGEAEVWVATRGDWGSWGSDQKLGATDANGDYKLTGLAPFQHRITLRYIAKPGVWAEDVNIISATTATWDFHHDVDFSRGARVSGRITKSNGEPLAGATASLTYLEYYTYDGQLLPLKWSDFTEIKPAPDGSYAFWNLPEHEYHLSMRPNSSQYFGRAWSSDPNGSGELLELGPGDSIVGADATLYQTTSIWGACPACAASGLNYGIRIERHVPELDRWVSDGTWRSASQGFVPGEYRVASDVFAAGYTRSTWSAPFTVTENVDVVLPDIVPQRADLKVRTSSGNLYSYPATTSGKLGTAQKFATGFSSYKRIFDVGDITGDGLADLYGITTAGTLYRLAGKADGGYLKAVKVSTGWSAYRNVTSGQDVTGDGNIDVVAQTTGGTLYVFPGTGTGGLGARQKIGGSTAWKGYAKIALVEDWDDDGLPDLVGVGESGTAYLFRTLWGEPLFGFRQKLGTGLKGITQIVSVGRLGTDARYDLMVRSSSGNIWLWKGQGMSPFLGSTKLASAWSGKLLF